MADAALKSEETLDDIMLAMDIVDTLRHEHVMVEKDLAAEDRRQNLIQRLRGIYKAQGIEVPDEVLMDGVMALEEERFRFVPAKKGFGTKLASIYINRKKWLPLIFTVGAIIGSVLAINYVGFERPQQLETQRQEALIDKVLPGRLEDARDKAASLAATPALKSQAEDLYQGGLVALSNKDIIEAETAIGKIENLSRSLGQSYQLRIISRFNEASGIWLESKTNNDIRNFYLIVEAVDTSGQVLAVDIKDEEYKKTERVNKFGVRVPKSVFDAVAADKKDDQIIQDDILGQKKRGVLDPTLKFEGPLGFITDW